MVLVQTNRLSCPIVTDGGITSHRNLVLPGNIFSAPIPSWALTHDVRFIYYAGWWQSWGVSLVAVSTGLCVLAPIVCFMSSGRDVWQVFSHDTKAVVQVRLICAKGLGLVSLVWGSVLLGLFVAGANMYACGKPWLYTTAAYLYDDPKIELAVAVTACLVAGCAGWGVRMLDQRARQLYSPVPLTAVSPPLSRQMLLWSGWVGISLVLSVPTGLYTVSTSLPANNTLGLSRTLLDFFHYCAGPALYVTSALLVPPLARWSVPAAFGQRDPDTEARLMIVARLFVALLVPVLVTLWFNQACFALWLQSWQPCSESGTFNIDVSLEYQLPYSGTSSTSSWLVDFRVVGYSQVAVTTPWARHLAHDSAGNPPVPGLSTALSTW